MAKYTVFFLVAVAVISSGCSPKVGLKRDREATRTNQAGDSRAEGVEYRELEALFTQKSSQFEGRAYSFLQKYPDTSYLHGVENLRGLLMLRRKKPELAIPYFRKALELAGQHREFNPYYRYNLASALAASSSIGNQRTDEALEVLKDADVSLMDPPNQTKFYFLKATLHEKKSEPVEAARQLLKAGSPNFDTYLESLLTQISDPLLLQVLYSENDTSPSADAALFRLGSYEAFSGNPDACETHLKQLLSKYPKSRYAARSTEILSSLVDQSKVDRISIGILIPTSGRFANFAKGVLQAIELALGNYDPTAPKNAFNLIIEDSGEDADQATEALTRLVLKHHVMAVIGPLQSRGVEQVAKKAQELGIPLLSLARREVQAGDFVFQAGLPEKLQAIELAKYAVGKLNAKKIAILYPNDKMGSETSQAFFETVEGLGGQVVGAETYNPEETDFRQPVDKLAGLYYTGARQRELNEMAKLREANGIKKRNRKTEQYFALKPIVDFEAVFILGEAQLAGQIIPTFAYRDIDQVKFLGTSSWNSADFISRTQSYAENSIFVDSFYGDSTAGPIKDFITKYRNAFGQEPGSSEGLAYDAGRILFHLLSGSSAPQNRTALRERLKNLSGFQGATGSISFQDGRLSRNLTFLSVKSGKVVQL